MQATMMDMALSTQMILRHGGRLHGSALVRSFDGERFHDASFAEVAARAGSLATALAALGVGMGDRVATFCWNHQAHLEAYLAIPAMGAILHTLNIRLFPAQVAAIMAHAEDRVLIADASLLPTLLPELAAVPSLRHIIVVDGDGHTTATQDVHDYGTLLAGAAAGFQWPELAEKQAAVACYTTGTTGDPKGIVYSHRSIFLHTLGTLGRDTFGIGQDDRILLLPSMFHANAWGLPFSAWFSGATLLLPGPHLKAANIRAMVREARPTITALVPTLVNDLLQADRDDPVDMSSFRALICGGSAVSPALISRVREQWGVPMLQGWGMTETSPMCCLSIPPVDCSPQDEPGWRAKSGRPVPGMQVRLVDEHGSAVAEDGVTIGELQLRGPWVTGSYHKGSSPESFTDDGWLRTGDVGTIDTRGYVQVTDRSKDVIKSGGEWVSSVDLENQVTLHPDVFEAAVIGIPDPRWEERPLVVVVPRPGARVQARELRSFLEGKVARFWLPEYFAFPVELPKTSVGKIDKKALRRLHAEGGIAVESIARPA